MVVGQLIALNAVPCGEEGRVRLALCSHEKGPTGVGRELAGGPACHVSGGHKGSGVGIFCAG